MPGEDASVMEYARVCEVVVRRWSSSPSTSSVYLDYGIGSLFRHFSPIISHDQCSYFLYIEVPASRSCSRLRRYLWLLRGSCSGSFLISYSLANPRPLSHRHVGLLRWPRALRIWSDAFDAHRKIFFMSQGANAVAREEAFGGVCVAT